VWLRIREVEQSLALIEQILERLPSGPVRGALNRLDQPGEGVALVEGFRGDILVWLRLEQRRRGGALPSARSVLVSVAAAGGRHRKQHRGGFSAVQ
jgi:Ni,Fe-hydrogenase III large subunit